MQAAGARTLEGPRPAPNDECVVESWNGRRGAIQQPSDAANQGPPPASLQLAGSKLDSSVSESIDLF
jgi:hypothetical protein